MCTYTYVRTRTIQPGEGRQSCRLQWHAWPSGEGTVLKEARTLDLTYLYVNLKKNKLIQKVIRFVATRSRGLRVEESCRGGQNVRTPSLSQTRTEGMHNVTSVVACCVVCVKVVKAVDPKSSHLKEKNCTYTKWQMLTKRIVVIVSRYGCVVITLHTLNLHSNVHQLHRNKIGKKINFQKLSCLWRWVSQPAAMSTQQ